MKPIERKDCFLAWCWDKKREDGAERFVVEVFRDKSCRSVDKDYIDSYIEDGLGAASYNHYERIQEPEIDNLYIMWEASYSKIVLRQCNEKIIMHLDYIDSDDNLGSYEFNRLKKLDNGKVVLEGEWVSAQEMFGGENV